MFIVYARLSSLVPRLFILASNILDMTNSLGMRLHLSTYICIYYMYIGFVMTIVFVLESFDFRYDLLRQYVSHVSFLRFLLYVKQYVCTVIS